VAEKNMTSDEIQVDNGHSALRINPKSIIIQNPYSKLFHALNSTQNVKKPLKSINRVKKIIGVLQGIFFIEVATQETGACLRPDKYQDFGRKNGETGRGGRKKKETSINDL